jgi:hypothetical protein
MRILLLVVTLLAPASLAGQAAPVLNAGVRVRFWQLHEPGAGRVAVVSAVSGDTLSLALEHQSEPIRLTFAALDRLEVSAGRSRLGWNGSFVGFGIGAVLGAVIGAATSRGTAPLCDLSCNTRPVDAAAGALVGGLLGALIGASVRHERWIPVALPARGFGTTPAMAVAPPP